MKAPLPSSSTPTRRSSGTSPSDTRERRDKRRVESWTRTGVLRELKRLANPAVRAKMAHFGVRVSQAYGIPAPALHALARRIGTNHRLAEQLWSSGIHEARILATLIGDSAKVTAAQMDRWARNFNAWDVVDAACCYLYPEAVPAWYQVKAWSRRPEEYVKRAAFSLAAYLSYKDKEAPDAQFEAVLLIIEREAHDDRNFVRKAVNWALRNIGKRNLRLNRAAIRTAERIGRHDSRTARWIAADALRELRSESVQNRLRVKERNTGGQN